MCLATADSFEHEFLKILNQAFRILTFWVSIRDNSLSFSELWDTTPPSLHIIVSARYFNFPSYLLLFFFHFYRNILPTNLQNNTSHDSILTTPQHIKGIHYNYTTRDHNIIDNISNFFSIFRADWYEISNNFTGYLEFFIIWKGVDNFKACKNIITYQLSILNFAEYWTLKNCWLNNRIR